VVADSTITSALSTGATAEQANMLGYQRAFFLTASGLVTSFAGSNFRNSNTKLLKPKQNILPQH